MLWPKLLVLQLLVLNVVQVLPFYYDRDFILVFPELAGVGVPVQGAYILCDSPPISVSALESGTTTPYTLMSNENTLPLGPQNIIYASGKSPKMVRLQSDKNMAVFVTYRGAAVSEMFAAIPVSGLGKEYYVVTYCEISGQPCQIQIVGTVAGTTVEVKLAQNRDDIVVDFLGSVYIGGDTITFTLEDNEAAQIQSDSDLTGSRITATSAVAVFSGGSGTTIQGDGEGFLNKPMPAVTTWGKEYVFVPTPGRVKTGDYLRILTSGRSTKVTISGESPVVIPNAGQWIQRNFSQKITVTADKAIMVVKLSLSVRDVSEPGFPTMMILTPTNQFIKGMSVKVPTSLATTANTLIVVTKSKYSNSMSLNSNSIASWVTMPGTQYNVAEIAVTDSYNEISSSDANAEFGVSFYGHGTYSNSYIGGRNFNHINPVCVPSVMSIGDEVDNDCDGLADEDTCTPADYMGKDCAVIISGERDVFGTTFVFGFPYHRSTAKLNLYITSETPGLQLDLRTPNLPAEVNVAETMSGTTHIFTLTSTDQVSGSDRSNKTLRLTSPEEITVIALSSEALSDLTAGAFRLIPVDGLGRLYFAATYCETNDCFIVISAVHPDTAVEIQLTLDDQARIVTFAGQGFNHGDVIKVKLAEYESCQILSSTDMTGSKITSNKPISIITGGQFTRVKKNNNDDMVVEQLPPVQALGNKYALVQSPGRVNDPYCFSNECEDYVRVIATEDQTDVQISLSGSTTPYPLSFQGSFTNILLSGVGTIISNKPVLVVQLLVDNAALFDGGMVVIAPISQLSGFDHILLPFGSTIQNQDIRKISLVVIANQSDTSNILYNGNSFSGWMNLPEFLMAMSSATIPQGGTLITGTANSVIGGHVSTNMQEFATGTFAFPLAYRLDEINQPCMFTPSEPGDGLDNDCDGFVDEENCTSVSWTDEDFDGMFHEDCKYKPEESSSIAPSPTVVSAETTPTQYTDVKIDTSTDTSELLSTELVAVSSSPHTSSSSDSQQLTVQITIDTSILLDPSSTVVESTEPPQASSSDLKSSSSSSGPPSAPATGLVPSSPTLTSHVSIVEVCTCICSSWTTSLAASSLTQVIESIKKELTVDRETVSQTVRKKISAPDDRPSAVSMGIVGLTVISGLVLGIFVIDAGSIFRDILSLIQCCRETCRPEHYESKI